MATYPGGVYAPRTKANRSGVSYDPAKTTVGFAEDVTKLDDEIVAIETDLLAKLDIAYYGRVPPGAFFPYGNPVAPTGFLLCDGSAVSRTTYAALFAVIGTSFGAGNGSTTFNLPDVNASGRIVKGKTTVGGTGGASTHTHTGPSHTHTLAHTHTYSGTTAAWDTTDIDCISCGSDHLTHVLQECCWTHNHNYTGTTSAASTPNTGAGGTGATGATSSWPPYLESPWIIKT